MRNPTFLLAITSSVFLVSCGGEPVSGTPASQKLGNRYTRGDRESAVSPEALDRSGLVGPPGSAAAPTSQDPVVRAVEDRLFKTDGGRVVLRSIRVHGGWRRWLDTSAVRASVQVGEGGGEPATAVQVVTVPTYLPEVPQDESARRLTAPFWLASPALKLDYLGVVVDGQTGDTYDMVEVFEEKPDASWWVAYFSRKTGILARLLEPAVPARPAPPESRFSRIDLLGHREVSGLWLATRWETYRLPTRFTRVEIGKPDLIAKLDVSADAKAAEAPAP